MSSSGDFFKGLVFGTVVGVTAGILLAPKSGEETREEIKKFALDTADDAERIYRKARRDLRKKLADVKEVGANIDVNGYKKLVAKVVDEIKTDGEVTSDVAKKVGEKLSEDWNELKSALV